MADEPQKFRNHYRCPHDGTQWTDSWSCMCNDRCPVCHAEIEPYASEELCLRCGAVVDSAEEGLCPECGEPVADFDALQAALADRHEPAKSTSSIATAAPAEAWIVLVRRAERVTNFAYEFTSETEARSFIDAAPAQGLWLRLYRSTLTVERRPWPLLEP